MPEQIQETPQTQPVQTAPVVPRKKSKIIQIVTLLIVILLIAGGIYAGMQIEKKKVKVWVEPPLTEITPQPTEIIDETINWKTYSDNYLFYEIKYPENWYLIDHDQGSISLNTFPEEIPMTAGSGAGENDIHIGISIKGEIPSLEDYIKKISAGRVVKEKENIKIGSYPATQVIYDQEVGAGMPIIFFSSGKYVVTANVYWGSEKVKEQALSKFYQILSTFKFLDQKETRFSCPSNGWIDCMPIMTEEKKLSCSAEAEGWYKSNCPDFKGFAQ